MANEFGYIDSMKAAREAQQKFDYFFLGVILATLSLSIQAHFSSSTTVHNYLLFLSWFLWLLSFLAGFFRQERTVSVLTLETGYLSYKPKRDLFAQAKESEQPIYRSATETWSMDEIKKELGSLNEILEYSEVLKKKRSKQALVAYRVTKWSYFLGVISFIIYRVLNI